MIQCFEYVTEYLTLQGIVVLNIQSFMGGTNFWGSAKDDNIFLPPGFDDGILEVLKCPTKKFKCETKPPVQQIRWWPSSAPSTWVRPG